MDFKITGPNSVEVTTADGTRVLFSYGEPVALRGPGKPKRTDRYVSRTTEHHITEFLNGAPAERVPHADILRATKEAR